MINVGIIGAGGYAGVNLLSLLLRHPQVKVVWLMSEEAHQGKKIADLFPHLTRQSDLACYPLSDLDKKLKEVDFVFLALPAGIALHYVPKIVEAGKKVVDLGADYRFSDQAVFGLPELYRDEIKKAQLIANPGCYPTASLLGAAPLVKEGLVELDSLIVDAKSGVSGAGRGISLRSHFCERNEGIEAYQVTTHRHRGEIEFQLSKVAGGKVTVTFVPHLMPMNRGILATVYAKIKNQKSKIEIKDLTSIYKEFYKNEPFVRIYEDKLPNTKFVAGTNYCDMRVQVDEVTGMVIVLSAIDNLVKGAAGQAVQNMNLSCGFEESAGLPQIALFP